MLELKANKLALAIMAAGASVLVGCGGDSSSSSFVSSGNVLKMAGGIGGADGGFGGDGDYFEVDNNGSGDIIIGGGPAAKTGFSATNLNSIDKSTGSNPLLVTSDLSPAYVDDVAGKPVLGVVYMSGDQSGGGNNGNQLRISDGNIAAFSAAEVVTGVEIASGATLTLPMNNIALSQSSLNLDNDVIIKGTLTVADDAFGRGDLTVYPSSVYVYASGALTTAGVAAGQDAGRMNIYPDYSFINHGSVLSYGADNTAGAAGDGDDQYITADYYFENTGLMDAHGGQSDDDFGGDAGWINNYADYGDCLSKGKILTYGGDGLLGGGDGNDIYLYANYVGDVKASGTLAFYGGNAGAGAFANGGDADYVELESYGGGVYSTAKIQGWGGDTEALDGNGGDGGEVDIYNGEGGHYETSPLTGVNIAGTIDLHGGNAQADGSGDGGDGGYVDTYVYDESSNNLASGQHAVFHFSRIDMNGGVANYPGDGGDLYVYNDETWSSPLSIYLPSGTIDMRASVRMYGADVAESATNNATGGRGGDVYVESDYYEALATPTSGIVKLSGNIIAHGGESFNATNDWAYGDYAWLWGYNKVQFANIDMSGGDDRAADGGIDGYGGDGGYVEVYSELGDVTGGTIDISGGYGEYLGGDADYFGAEGHKHRYTVKANGGNADVALAGSFGGDVDDVYIWSQQGPSGVTGVTLKRSVGTGETDGSSINTYVILGSTCTGDNC